MLAISGIDSTVKIFSADARSRRDAIRAENGVSAIDPSVFSSIGLGPDDINDSESSGDESYIPDINTPEEDEESETSEFEKERVADKGLRSKKRMGREYKITSKNDMIRRSEIQSQNIRSQGVYQMLAAQLAQQMRSRDVDGGELDADNPECMIM
jgi:DDB1- and CUL4-associated factor 6